MEARQSSAFRPGKEGAPANLRAWRARMGYTQTQAAQALGVSLRTVKAWESGFAAPPAFLELACAALAAGLGPWSQLSSQLGGRCQDD